MSIPSYSYLFQTTTVKGQPKGGRYFWCLLGNSLTSISDGVFNCWFRVFTVHAGKFSRPSIRLIFYNPWQWQKLVRKKPIQSSILYGAFKATIGGLWTNFPPQANSPKLPESVAKFLLWKWIQSSIGNVYMVESFQSCITIKSGVGKAKFSRSGGISHWSTMDRLLSLQNLIKNWTSELQALLAVNIVFTGHKFYSSEQ